MQTHRNLKYTMLFIAIMVFFSISCEKPRRGGGDDGGGNGENVLLTLPVTNVTTNSATLGGNIIDPDFEYTEKGVCYSETPNPTTDDYKLAVPGAKTGIYTIEATDLSQNTTYYVCAYATNPKGTVYGDIVDFTTLDEIVDILSQTGWLEDQEDMDNIPEDITPFNGGGVTDFPSSFSLEDKFPPIGDQGQYGTCVAWSVGYNLKTALNAIAKGWSSSDLANTANQTSPKDLWMAIPFGKKGSKCEGTNFAPALDALIASGAASMSSVPYTGLGDCDGTKVGDGNNKLTNYRKIAAGQMKKSTADKGLNVDNFKGYLSAGRPVAIGARLGDRFMAWNSSAVISSDTYNNPGMQHAYHAMALVGYDDNKNAFRVRNSWGTSWGDNGSIWVDYDFFCKNFCFAAFVAQNTNDISVGGGGIGGGDLTSGDDLLAFSAEDEPYEGARLCTYKVYNSGTTSISASRDWTVVYMYYNAVDANEYGIIYEDFYTDDYGGNKGDYGVLPVGASIAMYGGFWNNVDVASGQLVAGEQFPDGTMVKYPKLTHLTGEYYLVVMVDAFDIIREGNEDNNFYFITAANGKPLKFQNGEILNMPPPTKSSRIPTTFGNTENQTVVKSGNMNAYTPAEIRAMLLHDKKTGKLDAKMKAFRIGGGQGAVKVKK